MFIYQLLLHGTGFLGCSRFYVDGATLLRVLRLLARQGAQGRLGFGPGTSWSRRSSADGRCPFYSMKPDLFFSFWRGPNYYSATVQPTRCRTLNAPR